MRKLMNVGNALLGIFVVSWIVMAFAEKVSADPWARIYSGMDTANSIQQISGGGYIVAGGTDPYSLLFARNFQVLKLNGEGHAEWQKDYGPGLANSVQQTSDGGFIVAGWLTENTTKSDVPLMFIQPPRPGNIWILKLDGRGRVAWQKTYNLSKANSIQQTSEGGYIVAGGTDSNAWTMKLDPDGNMDWQQTFDLGSLNSIQQTSERGYIAAGETKASGSGYDVWVLKIDKGGNREWQKTYGGAGDDRANSIQQTSDGGFILAGYSFSFGAGNGDVWILKLDKDGNIQWQKAYGGAGDDGANSIVQTLDGGYVAAGWTGSFGTGSTDAWVLRLDKDGDIQWEKTYGSPGYDRANSIIQTPDGGYTVSGSFSGRGFFILTGLSPIFFKRVELQKGIRAAHHFVGMAHKEKFLCES